ncbi:uncharacterized protein LOC111636221 [Centruroides sculpturatus]|uniref:uncharacterized protein LOC111636221 n=1 Tax=Centruroides sculpturatus TaxID=218467 RepID=UPI000C6EA173|nr:uncharacterized protein LOC111636221 [Centruroides sculpturatus]
MAVFGAPVLVGAPKTTLAWIEGPIREALRTALGVPRTTPLRSLYAETSYIPLKERIRMKALKIGIVNFSRGKYSPLHRILATKEGILYYKWRKNQQPYVAWLYEEASRSKIPINRIYRQQSVPPEAEAVRRRLSLTDYREVEGLLPEAYRAHFCWITDNKWPKWILMGVDASKSEGHTFLGIVIPSQGRSGAWLLNEACSVFGAEAQGLLWSLRVMGKVKEPCAVFSDSLSVLTAVANVGFSSPGVIIDFAAGLGLRQEACVAGWTPGHTGVLINEGADRLARVGEPDGSIWRALMPRDVARADRVRVIHRLTECWTSDLRRKGREYLCPFANWHYKFASNRYMETVLARLHTETAPLNDFLHSRRLHDTPQCPHCKERETAAHFWLECPEYANARRDLGTALGVRLTDKSTMWEIYAPTTKITPRHLVVALEAYIA